MDNCANEVLFSFLRRSKLNGDKNESISYRSYRIIGDRYCLYS